MLEPQAQEQVSGLRWIQVDNDKRTSTPSPVRPRLEAVLPPWPTLERGGAGEVTLCRPLPGLQPAC